jgi:hypothetical protein
MMDKQEAQGKVAEQLKIAEAALKEAARVADEAKISFSWEGPSYGMGGYYEGDKESRYFEDWQESDAEDAGWSASSQSC